jgi:hypothetical protein
MIFSVPFSNTETSTLTDWVTSLLELDANIDWEAFRPLLERVRIKTRKLSAGPKPWDVILMFKGLVLVSFYSLSDEQLEFQIEDRRSFQRFIGLPDAKHAPDQNSFWLFREVLKDLKLTETLIHEFNRQLDRAGLIARKGQLVTSASSRRQCSTIRRTKTSASRRAKRPTVGRRTNAVKRTPTPASTTPNPWLSCWTTAISAVPFGPTAHRTRSRRSAHRLHEPYLQHEAVLCSPQDSGVLRMPGGAGGPTKIRKKQEIMPRNRVD